MKTIDKLNERIRRLPEPSQREVLDFVEFLLMKKNQREDGMKNEEWSAFSLQQALKGMEADETVEYTISDLKEKYL